MKEEKGIVRRGIVKLKYWVGMGGDWDYGGCPVMEGKQEL